MDLKTAFFYAFSAILLFAAFRVITARNPVHAALFLVLSFFQAAMLWMLLKAEFLAITLVLVYVGAVMVLFLFVVMMMDIGAEGLRQGFGKHFPLAVSQAKAGVDTVSPSAMMDGQVAAIRKALDNEGLKKKLKKQVVQVKQQK